MKKNLMNYLYVLLFVVTAIELNARSYYFKSYEVEDGLSNNNVTCSVQDHYGFMWFGTREECASMETEEEELQVFDILEKNVFYGMTGKFGPETDEQALDLRSDILKEEERENRMEKRALFYRRLREFFSLVRRQLKELYDILYSR